MATETQIGKLVIDLQIKTKALEQGLNTAKQKLKEIENSNKSLENSNKSLDASFIAMSASIVAALYGIGSAIKTCVDEYNKYTQAMSGLQNIADYTGQDMEKLTEIMNKFTKYGLTQTDIATAIKNFSLMGYTVEDTEKMLMALTESAISNRQACYSVSEAVKMASEGYKNGISTLSDAAGVTENLSVMESKYAESIGKTVGQLTEAEKNQAYLNRTMEAAAPFAGATAQYMETLAGKQGEYSQAMRETQVAYAEALEPTLIKFEEFKINMLETLNEFISSNEEATAGATAFILTLGTISVAITAVKKAYDVYQASALKATISTNGLTAAMLANPAGAIAVGISALVSVIVMMVTAVNNARDAYEELKQKLNETSEAQQRYNELVEGTLELTDENIEKIREDKEMLEQRLKLQEKQIEQEEKLRGILNKDNSSADSINKSAEAKEKLFYNNEKMNVSQQVSTKMLTEYNKALYKNMNGERTKQRSQLVDITQTKADIKGKQELLNILKKGNTATESYKDAQSQLVKLYPELANVNENTIKSTQDTIDAENALADAEWAQAQVAIQTSILEVQAMLNSSDQIINLANATGQSVDQVTASLQNQMNALSNLAKLTPEDFTGTITPKYTPKKISSSGSSSYSNKALDNYKKEIEHKKALDQISVQQEISMYEYALKKYAKTADEKNEIREKIYDLNKELAQKEKEILDQQTEDYEAYIQEQKNLRGAAYDITEQTSDYNKIIQMHRNYLNQIMQDERLSLEERKEIYREELQVIRDYEQQKRDLRVEQIDNTVSQLTDAITAQLEEMQEKDKELIDKNLEEVEKWKEARINAINEEYDARIEAIDKELEALNKAEEQKTRDEEDAEYERKKLRLEQLIEFEHDATTKANYQKELDKLIAEYQETLDKRALEDKKEALNEQKELLQQEQEDKVQAIEDEAEKQKEAYEKQLEDLEKYYEEQINMAQETAEKMLLNVEQNQNEILNLLQKYGDAYEITGQSLGEKLAQGINEGIASKIENIIQRIQDTIDAGIENKLAELSSSVYKYETGANKPQVSSKTINVYQTNNIEQNPELPSETYRKLKNIDEQLAAQLAGI